MRRGARALLAGVLLLDGCTPSRATNDRAIVAPPSVVPEPLAVGGESATSNGDIARLELAIGNAGMCARIDGRVHCARGDEAEPFASAPAIGGIDDATSLALGAGFGCLTTRRGTVHCWGSNAAAQLGAKLAVESSKDPVQVIGVSHATRVFAGDEHACALAAGGALFCWGLNESGETGGSTSWAPAARELATPNQVALRDVVSVAMGYASTCAIVRGGQVHCWGRSFLDEQRTAQGSANESPFAMTALKGLEDLSAASGAFCGVRAGEVVCAGATYGLVPPGAAGDVPAKAGVSGVTKVRVSGSHACALTRDGRVVCWGRDDHGQLGRNEPYDPNGDDRPKTAQPVPGIGVARDIVVSHAASCAITGRDEVWCWGAWEYGVRGALRHERAPVRMRIR